MYLVETEGVEPSSRNNGTCASTSVVDIFAISLQLMPTDWRPCS